jgi:predicted nuclease with TOPRIM domain
MRQQQSQEARFRAELTRLRTDLEELKSKIEENETSDKKMIQYLEQIEAKKDELTEKLHEWKESSGDAKEELTKGLKEAWDRLAIASKAAKARLH